MATHRLSFGVPSGGGAVGRLGQELGLSDGDAWVMDGSKDKVGGTVGVQVRGEG